MIIRMLACSAGPDHGLLANVIYDLPGALAKKLLAAKTATGQPAAELVVDPKMRERARKMEKAVQSADATWSDEEE